MGRIVTFSLADRFIDELSRDIVKNFPPETWPRLAIVFGGNRPRLFLQKALAAMTKKANFSPRFFSIDDFMGMVAGQKENFSRLGDLEACFEIYRLAQKEAPKILEGRQEFWRFLPWAQEILGFIEQLDLEDLQGLSLKGIAEGASIGYDVPESINTLLEHIHVLRGSFHRFMLEKKSYSRGFIYLTAGREIKNSSLDDLDHVLFCNFFYLHKTEEEVMQQLYRKGKATLYFQGDESEWSVLQRLSSVFGSEIKPAAPKKPDTEIILSAGFDLHSEIGLLRNSLKRTKDLSNSLIVLPEPSSVVPLLSEIASFAPDFNVSMGYPVSRTSIYFLIDLLFCAQETRKDNAYYVKDYLKLLGHPLAKNLDLGSGAAATRILVHKIEEVLSGAITGPLAGSLFVELEEFYEEDAIFEQASELLFTMGIKLERRELKGTLRELHELLFGQWEKISSFEDFSAVFEKFLDTFVAKAPLDKFPFHLKIVQQLYAANRQFKAAPFKKEAFPQQEILRVFRERLSSELVSFSGSPLKGLQILGLFETRSLGFDEIFMLDANESVLPKLKVYEPLIPRDIMTQLGLNRLEKEEEIQRYQFMRLLSSAKRAHIFYQERDDREKSRFVEALVWQKEKKESRPGALSARRGIFNIKSEPAEAGAKKRAEHLDFLSDLCFSASSVNTYMKCPLRFYYQYVLGLKEKDETADELEAADLGTFLHSFLEQAYAPFVGKKPKFSASFRKSFFALLEKRFDAELRRKMRSDAFLVFEVLKFRMERFLDKEAGREIEEVIALEKEVGSAIDLGGRCFRFKARLDRIDRLSDSSALVLDYKSGSFDELPKPPEKIFSALASRKDIKKNIRSFQLPLYVHLFGKECPGKAVNAGLYHLRDPWKEGLSLLFEEKAGMQKRMEDVSYYMKALGTLFKEMFDPKTDFKADLSDIPYCRMCPFSCLCR